MVKRPEERCGNWSDFRDPTEPKCKLARGHNGDRRSGGWSWANLDGRIAAADRDFNRELALLAPFFADLPDEPPRNTLEEQLGA